jgi:hypothetical protein
VVFFPWQKTSRLDPHTSVPVPVPILTLNFYILSCFIQCSILFQYSIRFFYWVFGLKKTFSLLFDNPCPAGRLPGIRRTLTWFCIDLTVSCFSRILWCARKKFRNSRICAHKCPDLDPGFEFRDGKLIGIRIRDKAYRNRNNESSILWGFDVLWVCIRWGYVKCSQTFCTLKKNRFLLPA